VSSVGTPADQTKRRIRNGEEEDEEGRDMEGRRKKKNRKWQKVR
jgi:hypothetical protein